LDRNAGPALVGVKMELEDQSPIQLAEARLRGPQGYLATVFLHPINKLEFGFKGSISLPESAPLGRYWVDEATLRDSAGNSVVFDEAALEHGIYGNHELQLYEGPDKAPPVLEGLTIAPQSVDTSEAPATVTMTLQLSDALSGVDSVSGNFEMPSAAFDYGFEVPQLSGTATAGDWQLSIPLPRHAAPGEWKLNALHISDYAGNGIDYYERPEVESLPYGTTFAQVGPGDSTPPQILGLSIEEVSSAGRHEIYFDVHLRDDLVGLSLENACLWLEAHSLAEPSYHFAITSPMQISGNALDGVMRVGTTFDPEAPLGTYVIDSIEACDLAWNLTKLSGAALEAKGWDLSFENPGI
jgi:hypothetical protein